MILELKAKHFRKTNFTDTGNCAISKALKTLLPKRYSIIEGVFHLTIWEGSSHIGRFSHRKYGTELFDKDKLKAKSLKYSKDEVVRRISIIGLKLKDFK